MESTELENIIFGRIKPHIYAFRTNTVPDYLKVGDTYRPVSVRLAEWTNYYKDLSKEFESEATINDDIYFRDYSIHQFLENEKKKHRLTQNDLVKISKNAGIYYSKEFFGNTDTDDVEDAINDIKQDYKANTGKYQFYNSDDKTTQNFIYERSAEEWKPRPNQQEVINNFNIARKNQRTNLLMYAVMRFGKSFTSLCCAKEMNAKFVLIVSAKADVKNEWKQNVEIPANFKGYEFLDSDSLKETDILKDKLSDKKIECVVLFLTLQDLQGTELKEKHKEVFENTIDLLIVDESHFGARAESYGQVLRNSEHIEKAEVANLKKLSKIDDNIDTAEADSQLKNLLEQKQLKVKIKIHLSGTPYRILMGSEFQKEDIICFCQFSDIVHEQENWDKENIVQEQNQQEVEEWDNPYYGFPQMIRFAFNPNESSIKKLNELKKNGSTTSFSTLFTPKSITKDEKNEYKTFKHEKEVLDLLEIIDGTKKDENILGFLDYDKLKEGKMCRHIVMVLPFCASCDAMQELIQSNKKKFKNLNTYEIVNISGLETASVYKDTKSVKEKINKCENEDKKTLTLTVNRMLTGTTVEQWDTMIFLKDTTSPQEYDQAIFRLQNQYIKIFTNSNGKKIKFNMKPQTLLVDFNPSRMFRMQETKSLIYNVNTDVGGNSKLENRIKEELRISPIITANKSRMEQVTPTNILDAVREYSSTRGIAEETNEIPVDLNLENIKEIFEEISRQNEIDSKSGFTVKAYEGEGTNIDTADSDENQDNEEDNSNTSTTTQKDANNTTGSDENESFKKKFKTYYARILFFAYLTEDNVISLEEIIRVADTEENTRILKNLSLSKKILELIQKNMDKLALSQLDYKIQNINNLSKDTSVEPLQRAMTALKKFGRLSESEVITPQNICDDMVALLPKESLKACIKNNRIILDINSKTAEFAIALYKRYTNELKLGIDSFKNTIYSIPSSKITYEFTRKIYKILGLNFDSIAKNFVSYDLLEIKCKDRNGNETKEIDYERVKAILSQNKKFSEVTLDDEVSGDIEMKFEAIVGNPPYQEEGNNNGRKQPIYYMFMNIAYKLAPIVSLITPARFLFNAGETPKEWNQSMLEDDHFSVVKYWAKSENIFPSVDIKGGVMISIRDTNQKFDKIEVFSAYHELNSIRKKVYNSDFLSMEEIVSPQGVFKFSKKAMAKYVEIAKLSGSGTGDKIISKIVESANEVFKETKFENSLSILAKGKTQRITKYISRENIQENNYIDTYNVLIPESNGAGAFEVFSTPVIAKKNEIFADTFLAVGTFCEFSNAESAMKYIKTKFARALLGILKATQHNPKSTWKFVPLQDFTENSDIDWTKSIPEIDAQLYKKYNLSKEEIEFIEKMIKPME